MVTNTYKNVSKEEKIQLYIRFLEYITFEKTKGGTTNEKNRNLRSTEPRQKR